MHYLKTGAKKIPYAVPLVRRGRAWWQQARRDAAWRLHPQAIAGRRRFRALRDRHAGQRGFIIGNGPSLRQMDLTPLRDEVTFGLNRIYLLFPEMGFPTTYFVSVNAHVIEQFAHEIEALAIPRFIAWESRADIRFTPDMMYLRSRPGPHFYDNPVEGIYQGYTVTYVAMQIAFYLGLQTVYLIGVDHNFHTKGPANRLVVSAEEDPNHFHPDYFGRGARWQLPDLERSEEAYRLAHEHYTRAGRAIYNATLGGKLEIFPRVNYADLF